MPNSSIHQKFTVALDALVDQIKRDRSVLATILCGSLSHDTVWEKSDIDLVLVTIDDKNVEVGSKSLYTDGINVHAFLMSRSEFRRTVEGAIRNSFIHSLLAKGKLLHTHDESIAALCSRLGEIGGRDTQLQLLRAGMHALGPIYKAHKWLLTRGDLDYTALWILYTATPLAQIEIISRRLLADREVIPQALKLNPELFKTIYTDLLNARKTKKNVEAALSAVDDYIRMRATGLFGLVIDHLREVGEVRSSTEIDDHFKRNFDVGSVTLACEYLADQNLIGKASTAIQLTKRSNVEVQELSFFYLQEPMDVF